MVVVSWFGGVNGIFFGGGRRWLWGCVLGVEGSVVNCWWVEGFSLEKGVFSSRCCISVVNCLEIFEVKYTGANEVLKLREGVILKDASYLRDFYVLALWEEEIMV